MLFANQVDIEGSIFLLLLLAVPCLLVQSLSTQMLSIVNTLKRE